MYSLLRPAAACLVLFAMLALLASSVAQVTSAVQVPLPNSTQTITPAERSPLPPAGPNDAAKAPPPIGSTELLIGSGDLLEVSVYGAPDFTRQARVADSGEISLPLLGSVQVAGLTIRRAELLIQQQLSKGGFFTDPQVSILTKEYATQGISVLGEVQKPGIYPLLGARKLYDAISAAGGVTPKAGNSITITHRAQTQPQTVLIPHDKTFPPEVNADVFPGDTIVVSKAGIVYVVGDVRMPSGFVMENSQITVLQAIAMAQGTNNTAKLDKTILVRKTPDGQKEIPVLLGRIMSASAPDIQLQADDVVFVPRSESKAAARRGLEAALQTITGLAVYGRL